MAAQGRMPDVRAPPEGLREWTLQTYGDHLACHGLLYEAEYVENYDPPGILDEWAKPRKTKMVRAWCSCCGTSTLLNWGKDQKHGYGFVHPDDVEGDWEKTVTAAGDDSVCPICGERVLVNKAAAIGRGYYVTAECSVMSAGLVGELNMLALTGWTVQRRVYRSGHESLKFIPAEAYIFSASGCAQLMGWRNSYSGACGYFISYTKDWRQPERWSEKWGAEGEIYGLTPELIERSCLPNCKLDVYMAHSVGTKRYPVAYLRLYQARPNVEHVLVHGLPRVLHDLIAREVRDHRWAKNCRGLMDLPEINWEEARPAQMLRLTKEELRLAQQRDWGLLLWNLFVSTREHGETLTDTDIENAFRLGDDNVAELAGRGPVAKSIRYLLRQCEALAVEEEDEDPDTVGIPDVRTLLDYWTMAGRLGRNLNDQQVRFPRDLLTAHDQAALLIEQQTAQLAGSELARQFRIRRRLLQKYCFHADGLLIRPAASQRELREEGRALHHCVGSYANKHASGMAAIFFIRRLSRPREPYFTLELDESTLTVRQNRGMCNCDPPPEVEVFVQSWLALIQSGLKKKARLKIA